MAQRDDKKRLGKKHRQASTRPKKGRAPKSTPTTGAVDPRKRKVLSTKRAAADKASRVTKQSPDREKRKTIRGDAPAKTPKGTPPKRPADGIVGRQTPRSSNMEGREEDWRDIELLASQMVTETESVDALTCR
jgi:GTP-binding protein